MKKQISIRTITPLTENQFGNLNGGFSDIMTSIHLNSGAQNKTKETNDCTTANNCGKGLNCGKCGYPNK